MTTSIYTYTDGWFSVDSDTLTDRQDKTSSMRRKCNPSLMRDRYDEVHI